MFYRNASGRKIYVPASDDDSIINAYKAAQYWSDYADSIMGATIETVYYYNLVTAAPADWSGEYIVGSIAKPSLWYMEKRSSTTYETTHCLRAELTAPAFNGTDKVETTDIIPTILVEKVAGTEFYSIKFNDEYLGWKTGVKNYFAFSATAPTAADTGFLWSFSIVDGLVKIDLQLMDGTKTRSLQYNSNATQERFSVYAGTQNNVSLFALAK
jgi:hypothetical protein